MKIKDKIKSYSFWVSLASAVILILKVIGSRFGFTIDESMVSDAFTAICSILVLLGIIVVPTNQDKSNSSTNTSDIICNNNSFDDNTNTSLDTKTLDKTNIEITNNESMKDIQVTNNKNLEINTTNLNNENKSEINTPNTNNENELENQNVVFEPEIQVEISSKNNNTNLEEINNCQPEESIQIVQTQNTEEQSTNNKETFVGTNFSNQDINIELKSIFEKEREKFAENINEYIIELQEELRKVRERM